MSEINRFKEETAVVIITCNRPDFCKNLVNSINRDAVAKIYIINAGEAHRSKSVV